MAKRFFTATTAKVAFAAAGAILLGFAVSEAFDKPKTTTKKRRLENNPAPYKWDEAQVKAAIRQLTLAGETDQAFIASEVAARLFGTHPGGETVSFPPGPSAPDGANCVWVLTTALVEKMLPATSQIYQEPVAWTVHHPDDEGYPWDEPSLHPDNIPTPGMFFDAGSPTKIGDTVDAEHDLEKTVRRALAQALVMARMDPTLATGTSNTSKRLRKQMRQLIVDSDFHDRLYGQDDLVKAGGHEYAVNARGRSLNWLPVHADNLTLVAYNRPLVRTTDLHGNSVMPGSSAMLLWIPAIDLAALSDKVPSVEPYQWPDGSSTQEPPPAVANLGIDMSGVSLPGAAGY